MNPAGTPSLPELPDAAGPRTKPLRNLRILVVDDDPHVRTLIASRLRRDSHEVEIASNSEWALALHAQRPFDAVIADLVMLGMGGVDLARAIKERSPGTPIILVTAHQQELETPPFDFIIRKPFAHCVLRSALDLLCSREKDSDLNI